MIEFNVTMIPQESDTPITTCTWELPAVPRVGEHVHVGRYMIWTVKRVFYRNDDPRVNLVVEV